MPNEDSLLEHDDDTMMDFESDEANHSDFSETEVRGSG